MTELQKEIGDLWREVNRSIHERIRHIFKGFDLPPTSLILLRTIHHEPGITVSELARRSGTVKSHVSKQVDQLVSMGLMEKRTDPDDQRLVRIYMTQAALNKKNELESKVQAAWTELMVGVPEADLKQAAAGLRVLLSALERSTTPMGDEPPC